jgi:hypothetical protein
VCRLCKQEAVEKSLIFFIYFSGERAAKFQVVSLTAVNKSEEGAERGKQRALYTPLERRGLENLK